MFAALTFLIFASFANASPLKRQDYNGLTVDINVPSSSITSIGDLSFVASVTNTNQDAVKILKYGTVLDSLPTRSFTVTKDGAEVPFIGIRLSILPTDDAYITVQSGETVHVTHRLTDLYDFQSAGTGKFSFAPVSSFFVAGATDTISSVSDLTRVNVLTSVFNVNVNLDVAQKRHAGVYERNRNVCDEARKAAFIDASFIEGQALAANASAYISDKGSRDQLYKSYFGSTNTHKIIANFDAVANENDSSHTLSCTDDYNACDGNVIAYTTVPAGDIYFCDLFYNEVPPKQLCTGESSVENRNIRGGTVVHELTHAVDGTDDVTYGCSDSRGLSDSDAASNADTYNCFSIEVYAAQC